MKKYLILLILSVYLNAGQAQERIHITQYGPNQEMINPAVIGSYNELNLAGLFRSQWVGITGAPTVGVFNVFSPVKQSQNYLGGMIIYDAIGMNKRTQATASYAYRLKLNEENFLSFGAQLGIEHLSYDLTNLTVDPNDQLYYSLPSKTVADGNVGLYFFGKRYYAGFSGTNLFDQIHFNIHGGYTFDLQGNFALNPSILIKATAGAPVQADLNVQVLYNNLIGLGLSFRTVNEAAILFEVRPTPMLKIGYSYDMNVGGDRTITALGAGSHEIFIRYQFLKQGTLATVSSPRF